MERKDMASGVGLSYFRTRADPIRIYVWIRIDVSKFYVEHPQPGYRLVKNNFEVCQVTGTQNNAYFMMHQMVQYLLKRTKS